MNKKKIQLQHVPKTPKEWVPDNLRPRCVRCHTKFSFFNRYHHCRLCGECVCAECSRKRLKIPGLTNRRVRICDHCAVNKIKDPNENIITTSQSEDNLSEASGDGGGGSCSEDGEVLLKQTNHFVIRKFNDLSFSQHLYLFFKSLVIITCLYVIFLVLKKYHIVDLSQWIFISMSIKSLLIWYVLEIRELNSSIPLSTHKILTPLEMPQNELIISNNKKDGRLSHTDKLIIKEAEDACDQCLDIVNKVRQNDLNEFQVEKIVGTGDDKIEVYTCPSFDNKRKIFVTKAKIQIKPQLLYELFLDNENTPRWNPQVIEYKLVRNITKSINIMNAQAAPALGGAISSRDFLDIRCQRELEDGSFALASIADKFTNYPKRSGSVRGVNNPGGWFCMSTHNPNTTEFIWLMDTDIKGYVPRYLIEMALATTAIDFVNLLKKITPDIPNIIKENKKQRKSKLNV